MSHLKQRRKISGISLGKLAHTHTFPALCLDPRTQNTWASQICSLTKTFRCPFSRVRVPGVCIATRSRKCLCGSTPHASARKASRSWVGRRRRAGSWCTEKESWRWVRWREGYARTEEKVRFGYNRRRPRWFGDVIDYEQGSFYINHGWPLQAKLPWQTIFHRWWSEYVMEHVYDRRLLLQYSERL